MSFSDLYHNLCEFSILPVFDRSVIFGNAPVLVPFDEVLVPALAVDFSFPLLKKYSSHKKKSNLDIN